eukprot:CAMPEP_0181129206 /NCGR_PEP_ID=MMETSP1071-20121207/29199_1 /TAXON_ID=35127 /ORGANISM="Thalassiosira sp., Strain NH16" /LENGTH=344 /DNA_ID=CAMNT_0023215179 /DNA_START=343 /DNA_END=1374 /DNA_ORIENTATION=-
MSDHDTEEMIKQAKKTNASPFDYTISCCGSDGASSLSSPSKQSKGLLSSGEESSAHKNITKSFNKPRSQKNKSKESKRRSITPPFPLSSTSTANNTNQDLMEDIIDPFTQSLPPKPAKLSKEKDLQGVVKPPAANITKRKDILPKLNEANARILHLTSLVSSLHASAVDIHKSATTSRKDGKNAKALCEKFKDSRDKARAELNRLKDKQESAKVISGFKDKELRRMESELKAMKKDLVSEKKELEEVRKQLRDGGSGNAKERALELQQKKSEIELEKYRAKKMIDQQSKERAEQKKRDEKKERLKGISGGGGFGNGKFLFGDSDSDRRHRKKKKKKTSKHSRRR